ncbi:DUF1963 domain-containing protein [Pseudomonas sp. zfem004]|uniref:DUF1963 domain-containing protein n=1 Tax=Pseudomonas sp. zfem004 TaxID=3078199 RepID=UPI0029275ADB|nr:DUF1963 domain-containing protein [Pseudomonas sp. zfem004]MDU9405382.1 DUF1963 domain-containing protein [Pseudomonas sp. zfem004]
MRKLIFKPDAVSTQDPHVGGGCALPNDFAWPKDSKGKALLHLMTFPAGWVEEDAEGWLSLFTPYDQQDTYLHWEELTIDGENESVVIYHDNCGHVRNEYGDLSPARKIELEVSSAAEADKDFTSRAGGAIAWVQDVESLSGSNCRMMINGDDIDVGFAEESGIFSDGVVYVFLKDNFQLDSRPSVQGIMSFQFS